MKKLGFFLAAVFCIAVLGSSAQSQKHDLSATRS